MNLVQFLLILRGRYKVIVFTALLTVGLTLGISLFLPKQYTAETSVVVDVKSSDPIASLLSPAMIMPSNMATQVDVIRSELVARKVVKMLKLDESPAARENWMSATGGRGRLDVWLGELLQKKLTVAPSRDSNLITISYKGADPGFAAAVANAFAQGYIETAIELKVGPARQYARWFGEQAKVLRDNVEKTQSRLSEFQQTHGIVATDVTLDNEHRQLAELSSQLSVAQGQTAESRSKLGQAGSADTLPDMMQNESIQKLRAEVARLEIKLKESAPNLGKNHPQYQRMESELAETKNRLELETRHFTGSISTGGSVNNQRERELKAAIEAQKKKVLELKKDSDELAVLMRDVEAAKKAYDAVNTRFTQASLESQATQTNVSVLTPATDPIEPSSPKILLYTLAATFFGPLLGVAFAFMIEMVDRRVRSIHDLSDMLQLPVLGVIHYHKRGQKLASRHRRLAFWRRGTALAVR